ncbi:hypothetical protein BHECKSOX_821 [Bathymodiolus heckerae thiotrophic gill symbiont]|uniref:hypothetical protein n=1 Tax=Bathymodiolus heckerae thiotrophic gill symbiont TaxID=1052212 RepID=UPI0010AEF55A|nr:hypothetical protein [Bathymodiolus heckerae thiotrophic gill symbiont]SHN93684.1 hypothetical protein BHECKSOX_821 [Bathymodiolus heckerae thiotrophic gill symbiont]
MNFKKITASSLLLAGIAMSPHALAAQSFDGHTINVAFEIWAGDDVSNVLEITNDKDVLASDWAHPDEKDFYVSSPDVDYFDWDIDFNQNRIELTYTSIKVNDDDYEYSYIDSKGFHFQDIENSLPDIINVIVDADFAPPGFDPNLVTFDADNIYVNLRGSSCVNPYILFDEDMSFMPGCSNPMGPTRYNNRIKIKVEFASDGTNDDPTIDNATINQLYDWLESKYPESLPTHQDSFYIQGYYARFYEGTGFYVGSLKGRLYLYNIHLGAMIELGEISHLVEEMKAEMATDEMDNI